MPSFSRASLFAAFAAAISGTALAANTRRPELEPVSASFDGAGERAGKPKEVSGAVTVGRDLYIVSDKETDHYLYRVLADTKRQKGRFELEPLVDLAKLAGYQGVLDAMAAVPQLKEKDRRFDLEGLAGCPGVIYAANERARQVLVIENMKSIRVAPIDFSAEKDLFDGGPNAGFEGIAADCVEKQLYVAKEREPRFIVRVDMKTWKVMERFDIPPSDRAGQKVINPFDPDTKEGLFTIGPDFGDLLFQNGCLYAVERNHFEIAKIDPKTKAVLARVSYYKTEKGMYETGEPFGLGEALAMTPSEITIGLDNNNNPVSRAGEKKYGYTGEGGALLVFKRPAGF